MALRRANCLWQQTPALLCSVKDAPHISSLLRITVAAVWQSCLSRHVATVPKKTDRTPYLPSPSGGDPYAYWSNIWKQRPAAAKRERTQRVDISQIPRRAFLPDIEEDTIVAIDEALSELGIPRKAVRKIVRHAIGGHVPRDPTVLKDRVSYLTEHLNNSDLLPGFDPIAVATKPEALRVSSEKVYRKITWLYTSIPPHAVGPLVTECPKLVFKTPGKLVRRMPRVAAVVSQVLGVQDTELEKGLLPGRSVWMVKWDVDKVARKLEDLKASFGGEASWQMVQICPEILHVPDRARIVRSESLGEALQLGSREALASFLCAAPELLLVKHHTLKDKVTATAGQLRAALGLGSKEEALELIKRLPAVMLVIPQQWQDVLAQLKAALDIEQQQQLTQLVLEAPEVLLRSAEQLEASGKALVHLPPTSPLGIAPEAAKALLLQKPQLLLVPGEVVIERLEQADALRQLSDSWGGRVGRLREDPDGLLEFLRAPQDRTKRLRWMVEMSAKEAPLNDSIGLPELLLMPQREFDDLYPGMGWKEKEAGSGGS